MDRLPAGPRMYLPLDMPEGSIPTYAVLEFVGFSSPPSQQHQNLSSPCSASAASLALSAPRAAAVECSPPTNFVPYRGSPDRSVIAHEQGHEPSVHVGEKQEIVYVVDTHRSSSASSSSCLSYNRELTAVPPVADSQPLLKSVTAPKSGIPQPLPLPSEDAVLTQPPISVSQTERGTLVHTHSSNFREVVRQLTGASSDSQGLLPVTLPARLANRGNSIRANNAVAGCGVAPAGCFSKQEPSITTPLKTTLRAATAELGLRKASLKLHERRKAMCSLEKLCPAYCEVPKLIIPSPVTPLASDFEKFCTARTPTLTVSMSPIYPATPPTVEPSTSGTSIWEPSLHVADEEPKLLNLFPESPTANSRDL